MTRYRILQIVQPSTYADITKLPKRNRISVLAVWFVFFVVFGFANSVYSGDANIYLRGKKYSIYSMKHQRDANIEKQTEMSDDCGPAALATLFLHLFNVQVPQERLKELIFRQYQNKPAPNKKGVTYKDMKLALMALGFECAAYWVEPGDIYNIPTPALTRITPKHGRGPHFVVILGVHGNTVYLADPAAGPTGGNTKKKLCDFLGIWLDREGRGQYFQIILPDTNEELTSTESFHGQPIDIEREAAFLFMRHANPLTRSSSLKNTPVPITSLYEIELEDGD